MNLETTYFLSSLDSTTLKQVREVRITSRMTIGGEKHAVVAVLTPGFNGQDVNVGADIDTVVLTHRFAGADVWDITEFPLFVYVCLPTVDPKRSDVDARDLTIIGWAELYRTVEDARHHVFD